MTRRKGFALLVIVLCFLCSFATAEDWLLFFNGLTWRSAVEDVMAAEGLTESDVCRFNENTLINGHEMQADGYTVQSVYVFINNRLRIAGYNAQMDTTHTEATEALWKLLMEANGVNAPLTDDEAKEKIGEFSAMLGSTIDWPEGFHAMENAEGILVMAAATTPGTYAIA